MAAFSNINWPKAAAHTAVAMSKHADRGNLESLRGWVDVSADVAGIVAAVATEAATFKIPVVNIIAPPLAGAATRKAVKWAGNKAIDYFEKRAKEKAARPSPGARGMASNLVYA